MIMTTQQVRSFYDRLGSKQDTQAFYEDPALDELIAHGAFGVARRILELGCGTGRLARRLLREELPGDAVWVGMDLSRTMVGITAERLAPWTSRAGVVRADGHPHLPVADASVDRLVATYVFDLLPPADIRHMLAEAARVLRPGGRLCLAGLGHGTTAGSRVVSTLWSGLHRLHPSLVGGCRPLRLTPALGDATWRLEHRSTVTPYAVPSEVIVAARRAP